MLLSVKHLRGAQGSTDPAQVPAPASVSVPAWQLSGTPRWGHSPQSHSYVILAGIPLPVISQAGSLFASVLLPPLSFTPATLPFTPGLLFLLFSNTSCLVIFSWILDRSSYGAFFGLLSKAGVGSVGTMPQLISNVCQGSRLAEGGMYIICMAFPQ